MILRVTHRIILGMRKPRASGDDPAKCDVAVQVK